MKIVRKWLVIGGMLLSLMACSDQISDASTIRFATSAEYPPFEYIENGKLRGFDIDLATLIAKEMGKEAIFEDMNFNEIFSALQKGNVDAAIATITITPERESLFGVSTPYYFSAIVAVYKDTVINSKEDLYNKKVACQKGTTLETWLKNNNIQKIILVNNNYEAIQALEANKIDVILMDAAQGATLSKKYSELFYQIVDHSEEGYAILTPKKSPLLAPINKAILKLIQDGSISELQDKWLTSDKSGSL